MFGSYDIPLKIANEGLSLSIEKEDGVLVYRRESAGEKEEKIILAAGGKILINPVEPLKKPKEITTSFLIEFDRAVIVRPKSTRKIFLKFPIEIAVFASENDHYDIIDIFTLMKYKFTLYGDPRNGVICKYFRSVVYSSKPPANPLYEGVLELRITNETIKWVEITKAVFNAYGMKIYYDDKLVSLRANMTLEGEELAETDFDDIPLEKGMKKSQEIYTLRIVTVHTTKFVMEMGL